MSKKHKKRLKDKRAFKLKLKPGTIFSIAQITFFIIAGLIIISFLRQGIILMRLNDLLIRYFSWTTVLLPFIFLSFGFLVSKFKTPLGQPNVIIGSLVFYISILTLGRAGLVGRTFWEGISTLITGIGAFIFLFGTSLVGIIILFNTSIDQVVGFFVGVFQQYGVRGRLKNKFGTMGKRPLKVVGEGMQANAPVKSPFGASARAQDKQEPLSAKLVSNV